MIKYSNNTESTLSSAITDTDTSLAVGTGDGDLFPAITSPDVFFVTLVKGTAFEIVKVTARVDNVFTIERAQEGTTAKAFAIGDKVQMLITAGHFEDLRDQSIRYDAIPSDPIAGLNAEKINGISSNEFHLKRSNLTLLDPLILDFGSFNREEIVLNQQYTAVDPEWDKVVLLLSMDGSHNSTVFTDSSILQNAITQYGDAKISTAQSKFGGASGYFDGTGDYLRIPYNSNLNFSLGDFTVECWFNCASFGSTRVLISKSTYGSNYDFSITIVNATTIGCWSNGTVTNLQVTVPTMLVNTWYHVAFVRQGGTNTFYLNGISYGSNTMGISNNSQVYITIGCSDWNNPQGLFQGYIDAFRITNGLARYTGNFTPPTSAFQKGWTDQTYDPYYLNTSLLMHFNGADNDTGFTDSSLNNLTITRYGDTKISTTQSKFGGASGYFDGNGDYLITNNGPNLRNSIFTIELWVYLITSGVQHLIGCNNSTLDFWDISLTPSNYIFFRPNGNNAPQLTTSIAVTINQWSHIAVVCDGSNSKIYINGVLGGTVNTAILTANGNYTYGIGVNLYGSPYWNYYHGYIDELRITKGVARYTANFTPSSLPYADSRNLTVDNDLDKVSLLMHFNGANNSTSFIDSSPNALTITRFGDTKISTSVYKFGGSSGYFDGTGDYLTTSIPNLGTENFTIEFWAYRPNHGNLGFFQISTNSSGFSIDYLNNTIAVGESNNNKWSIYAGNSATNSAIDIVLNAWIHVAMVRLSGITRLYVNGVSVIQINDTINYTGQFLGIGGFYSTSYLHIGYLDEFRVTKGVARYTADFIPPPVPFPDGNKKIAIGTQENTLYQRSSGNFAWYKSGVYSSEDLNPGLDGSVSMVLNENGNLLIGTTTDDATNLLQVNGSIVQSPLASVTPTNNGELVFEATSNTTITVKYKGSDGTVRTGTITLT